MKLVEILSAVKLDRPGRYDLQVIIDFEDGTIPGQHQFTYDPGDPFGLTPQVREALPGWLETHSLSEPSVPVVDLAAYAAARRFDLETGGVTLNGASIATDRDSQAMITGAYSFSQANPSSLINFKAETGWIQIDNATIVAIANAVGTHVQACFTLESQVDQEIASGTITTVAEIDAAFAASGLGAYYVEGRAASGGQAPSTAESASLAEASFSSGGTSLAQGEGALLSGATGESAGQSEAAGESE